MNNIIYRLADGRMWDVQKAKWVEPATVQAKFLRARMEASSDPDLSGVDTADIGGIIDLVSASGQSDVAYLVKALAFYDYPLGELVMYSQKGIKEELKRLDAEYLTPRTLAGLATGDKYALQLWREHEEKAAPLRARLEELESRENQQ